MDRITPERRSWLMSRVGKKNTAPEIKVRRAAHALGLRYRLHRGDLPGTPDLVFPKYGIIILVHGCFWHRHSACKQGTAIPKSNQEYWLNKFCNNVLRDRNVIQQLEDLGWKVEIIWECQTKDTSGLTKYISDIFTNAPVGNSQNVAE